MIADDRKESFHIIEDNRKRSQSRLFHTFRSAEVLKLRARCAGGNIAAHNMADVEKEQFCCEQIYFFCQSLSDVSVSFKTVFKTSASANDKVNFSISFQLLAFLFLSLKSLPLTVVDALISRNFLRKFLV